MRFMKWIVLCFVLSLAVYSQAADLINTGFEDADGWANHSTGPWTQTANDGTWDANAYANTDDAHSGSRKVGFNLATRYLTTPSVNKPGVLTFWATKSGGTSNWTVLIEKQINGGDWIQVGSFTANDVPVVLGYTQFTFNINDSSNNV